MEKEKEEEKIYTALINCSTEGGKFELRQLIKERRDSFILPAFDNVGYILRLSLQKIVKLFRTGKV